MAASRFLGLRPPQPQGPAPTGPLLLQHLSEQEGWAITENGRQVNPFLRTAPALAAYLSRHQLTARITNLDLLPPALQEVARRDYTGPR